MTNLVTVRASGTTRSTLAPKMPKTWSSDELEGLRTLYDSGFYTLKEMGSWWGLTCERMRQLVRKGGSTRFRASGKRIHVDPLATLRILHADKRITSWSLLAQASKCPNISLLTRPFEALEMRGEIEILFRERLRELEELVNEAHIIYLRRLGERIGRTPTVPDIEEDGKISHRVFFDRFRSLSNAQILAGFLANPSGYHGHRRSA